jgi:hypothetical protein
MEPRTVYRYDVLSLFYALWLCLFCMHAILMCKCEIKSLQFIPMKKIALHSHNLSKKDYYKP